MKMTTWLASNHKLIYFAGGMLAAIVVPKALRSKKARAIGVQSLASGMKFRQKARETFQNMKEDATDIYVDALQQANENFNSESARN